MTISDISKDNLCAEALLARINEHLEDNQSSSHRGHLGGSEIGHKCKRALWYKFRHWALFKHEGRLLRLFERGHLEEFRFVKYLQDIGIEVQELDPSTGKQWQIEDAHGHFGGSFDGIAWINGQKLLLEMKTHSHKSFTGVKNNGVLQSKPQHWDQMQVYMHKAGLSSALYMAVNKNDDELYLEIVPCVPFGQDLIKKAFEIIGSPSPDNFERIGVDEQSFACKWCDFRGHCWGSLKPERNCRTCRHSFPAREGQWGCTVGTFGNVCQNYNQIEDN